MFLISHFLIKRLSFTFISTLLLSYSFMSFAEETQSTKATPNALEQFFPFIILGLLFYFLLIRPQQRRHKNQNLFLSQIKRGDEVLTNSGIYGRIEGLTDNFVILEIAEDVRIRIVKSQIASFTGDSDNKPSTGNKKK